jgi:hypothetical protein
MIDDPTRVELLTGAILRDPEWTWTWGARGMRCLLRPQTSPSLLALTLRLTSEWRRQAEKKHPNA